MTEPGTRFRALPQRPITIGSTAYDPGVGHKGVRAWSSTLQCIVEWNGSSWDLPDALAREQPYGSSVPLYDRLHAADLGGRAMLEFDQQDADGGYSLPYILQPAEFCTRARSVIATPGANALQTYGLASNLSGTATARNIATTDAWDGSVRLGLVSAATAGSAAGWRHGTAQFYQGSTLAKGGGWFFAARFGFPVVTAGMRIFVGMSATVAAIGNVNPSTLVNSVGLLCDAADTDTFIASCGSSGSAVKAKALTLPKATTRVFYDVILSARPAAGKIGYAVRRGWWGADWQYGTLTASLPAFDTLLAPQVWASNGVTAAAMNLDIQHAYVETDY